MEEDDDVDDDDDDDDDDTDVLSFVCPVTKAAVFLEMLLNLYQIIWHHIPED
jgi:hypothetical protein